MLPAGKDGRTKTMQFIPVANYEGSPVQGDSFVTGQDTAGLVTVPNGEPLFREIREREHLVIPHGLADTLLVVKELGEGVLEIADHVTAEADGPVITVKMEGYRLIGGCRAVTTESPRCCVTNPCPVCSLFACLLAEGTGNVVQVERCIPEVGVPVVIAVFTLLP
jgi:hypothetical protein